MEKKQSYTVWIEAEMWPAHQWTPNDGNTDVVVTFANGDRWTATFVSYENVQTLTAKNRTTGENVSGGYFWVSNMILVDAISRQRIEEVIHDLLHTGGFEYAFSLYGKEEK
jgi:hypothetical protein